MKNALICLTVLFLAACGFQPMYGSHSPAAAPSSSGGGAAPEAGLDQIEVGIIPDAEGVFLRNALIDRFYRSGYPANPAYTLNVSKVEQSRSDYDITRESEATRRQLSLTTSLQLVDNATGQTVLSRPLKVVSSYDVIGSQFTTRVAEQDALEAALTDLARQIELQLALFFNRGGQ